MPSRHRHPDRERQRRTDPIRAEGCDERFDPLPPAARQAHTPVVGRRRETAVGPEADLAEQSADLEADRQELIRLIAAVGGSERRVLDEAPESELSTERLLRLRAEQRAGTYSLQHEADR